MYLIELKAFCKNWVCDMSEGFISIHRKVWDNPISKKPNYLAVWLFILSRANYTDKPEIINGRKVIIKRGSYYGSIAKIAEHFGLSRSVVAKIINYFERDGMVDTKRTRSYTVFTVLNYDDYQKSVHRENTARTPRDTTNKDNKDNKDNKYNIYVDQIDDAIHCWNENAEAFNLPKIAKLTKSRKTKMLNRLKDCDGIVGWRYAISKIQESEFLLGKKSKWKANIDWLLVEDNFAKLMEDGYTDSASYNYANSDKGQQRMQQVKNVLERNKNA